ncbi:hypothetical protein CANTEDRAFT_112457, partial [Yamadazyma tenuis ATCC 10573]
MSWLKYAAIALCAVSTRAAEISLDRIDRDTVSLAIGDYKIDEGVYWSIIDNTLTSFTGGFENDGSFYITTDNRLIGLTVSIINLLKTISNSGDWAFNASRTLTPPSYTLSSLNFQNTGSMWFGGDGSLGVPLMTVQSHTWENDGLIVFSLNKRSTSGEVILGASLELGTGTITNDGTVCLINQVYHQTTAIDGSGCFDIGSDSNVWL